MGIIKCHEGDTTKPCLIDDPKVKRVYPMDHALCATGCRRLAKYQPDPDERASDLMDAIREARRVEREDPDVLGDLVHTFTGVVSIPMDQYIEQLKLDLSKASYVLDVILGLEGRRGRPRKVA